MDMDWKTRMEDEAEELSSRVSRLDNFIGSRTFMQLSRGDQELLSAQQSAMKTYLTILNLRLMRAKSRPA